MISKRNLLLAALTVAAPATTAAQQAMPGMAMPGMAMPGMAMPGMAMPGMAMPGDPLPGAAAAPAAPPVVPHGHHPGMVMDTKTPAPDTAVPEAAAPEAAMPDMAMPGHTMTGHTMTGHIMTGHIMTGHSMTGALARYPAGREASGTSWQPDFEKHDGLHIMAGDWMLMGHAMLDVVYSGQAGPRGANKAFLAGMVMGMARRDIGDTTLQFRAMLSPDPLMGAAGYPLLLAAGETADGRTTLTDRQHPHDLFMELSTSLAWHLSERDSVFVYAGLPGEPAFGPPAFMHRAAIMDSPSAPISHHWLDSTHITFGVITAGVILGDVKLEASRFKGREPDQHRYDIETPKFDSTAVRLSWNPDPRLSLQASWADLHSPEQLSPDENQTRFSASALVTIPFGTDARWSSTLAWGRKTGREASHANGPALDAYVLESSLRFDAPWTVYGRAERIETDELLPAPGNVHGPAFTVGKVSLGAIRDVAITSKTRLGIGVEASRNFVPQGLDAAYGGDRWGGMVFIRLKVG